MPSIPRLLAQAALYALFFLPLVYFTQQPQHRHLDEGMAVLKIAVRHAGAIIGECTPIAAGTMDQRPDNMKRMEICPRERSPLQLELVVDGETLYVGTEPASGLHNDGVSSMYRRFNIPAGKHRLELLMNDDAALDGPTWTLVEDIEVAPAQVVVASFREGFRIL